MASHLARALGRDLLGALAADVAAAGLVVAPPGAPVTSAEIDDVPEPVSRYLRFMGVVGRPRDESFVVQFQGRFRLRPGRRPMPCVSWQYNTRSPVARLFHMRLVVGGVLPMTGRDSYLAGRGAMRGKLLGLVRVAVGDGPPFDSGELVTWLADAVLLAPSMLLGSATSWTAVDRDTFDVAVTDAGRTVTARVTIDESGAPTNFTTMDRFADLPDGPVRTPWSTPVTGWSTVGRRPVPSHVSARWELPDGAFTYIEGGFVAGSVTYDAPPSTTRLDGPGRPGGHDEGPRSPRTLGVPSR